MTEHERIAAASAAAWMLSADDTRTLPEMVVDTIIAAIDTERTRLRALIESLPADVLWVPSDFLTGDAGEAAVPVLHRDAVLMVLEAAE